MNYTNRETAELKARCEGLISNLFFRQSMTVAELFEHYLFRDTAEYAQTTEGKEQILNHGATEDEYNTFIKAVQDELELDDLGQTMLAIADASLKNTPQVISPEVNRPKGARREPIMATKKNTTANTTAKTTAKTPEVKKAPEHIHTITTGDIRQKLEELNAMRVEQSNILNRSGVTLRKSRKGRRKSEYTVIMEGLGINESHAFTLCSSSAGTYLDFMETGTLSKLKEDDRKYLEGFKSEAGAVSGKVQKIRSSITRLQKSTGRVLSTIFTAEETGDTAGSRVLVVTRES